MTEATPKGHYSSHVTSRRMRHKPQIKVENSFPTLFTFSRNIGHMQCCYVSLTFNILKLCKTALVSLWWRFLVH